MANNRKIIEQIIEVRSRRRSDSPRSELFSRLLYVERAYKNSTEQSKEVLKYYPIALVACMESYFRLSIKELIDSEERFFERATKLFDRSKFDFDVMKALHHKVISIGDFISHLIPLNNLTDIASHISELLGVEYLKELPKVHDRWAVEIQGEAREPIIKDADAVYRGVAKTFELRHIFCHEFGANHQFGPSDIQECFDHSVSFLKASDEYLSETLHPNAPLTQTDMNQAAGNAAIQEKEKLDVLNRELRSYLPGESREAYEVMHRAWEAFFEASVNFEDSRFGGTMRPAIVSGKAAELRKQRSKEIEELTQMLKKKF